MRKSIVTMIAVLFSLAADAQTGYKKVYNEDINPLEQIDQALVRAKSAGKFVICQVGGNWCPWCLRFADFMTNDSTISKVIADNFEYIHVNYNPRKSGTEVQQQQASALMKRLNNCGRFGFPVFVVLDENGDVIHIQDSSFLEDETSEKQEVPGGQRQWYSQEKVLRFFKNWTPKVVKPTRGQQAFEVDAFTTKSGKTLKFHALVHASIRIEYDGKEIEIDPVTKLGNRTINYGAMPKADYLFVTHEHGDHFDKEAIRVLSNEKTRFITNQRCAEMYGSGEVMANGNKIQIADDFTVEAVPAYNTTEGRLQFHPKGRDNGYILTIDGLRIYVAGDTEDIPEMADIKDIDIAFLPCNQPYTMTADQLVKAARIVKPKVLFPYHYGRTDLSGVPALLKGDGIDVRIRHYE